MRRGSGGGLPFHSLFYYLVLPSQQTEGKGDAIDAAMNECHGDGAIATYPISS